MSLVDQLNTGSHLSTVSEDLQVIWFEVEHQLSTKISDGHVPTYNIDSAGQYDSFNSSQHWNGHVVNPFSAALIIVPQATVMWNKS